MGFGESSVHRKILSTESGKEKDRHSFHPSFNFRKLNKEEQVKSTGSRRKEIKIREGSNEYENCKSISKNQ